MGTLTNTQSAHSKKTFYLLLITWLVLNLIQSYFTELINDEAYYYYYSLKLAWGYYDHPPMIALLIKMGYMFFHNELGVRIMMSILLVVSIIILGDLINIRNSLLFYTVLFSIFIFQASGFIAIPDSPLIFFTIFFFYAYRNYLINEKWQNILLISFAIAGLLYSKYLGLLILIFTLLSNIYLIKRKSFWIIFILSSVLMLPHLLWQINHDFVSFYFHLIERNRYDSFQFTNISDYILGQIGIINPVIVFVMFYYALKNKHKNIFLKALRFNLFGILSIGLFLTFFGHVEANWTSTAIIPLFLLAYPIIEKKANRKTIYFLGLISFVLVIAIRSYMVFNFLPGSTKLALQSEFHGWKNWAKKIETVAGNRPVIFLNSYQKASKYIFYTGKEAFSFNYLLYRKNQFDLNHVESGLTGRNVVLVNGDRNITIAGLESFKIPQPDSLILSGEKIYYKCIDNFQSYNFIPVEIKLEKSDFNSGMPINIPIEIEKPLDTAVGLFQNHGKTYLSVSFSQHGKVMQFSNIEDISNLWLDKKLNTTLHTIAPGQPGKYFLNISIRSGWLPPGLNSPMKKVNILP